MKEKAMLLTPPHNYLVLTQAHRDRDACWVFTDYSKLTIGDVFRVVTHEGKKVSLYQDEKGNDVFVSVVKGITGEGIEMVTSMEDLQRLMRFESTKIKI